MKKDARILFVFPSENEPCRALAKALQQAGWNITPTNAGLKALLFELRKYDLAHFLLPASSTSAQIVRKVKGKAKVVQTIVKSPKKSEGYRKVLFGERVAVFSNHEKEIVIAQAPKITVDVVPPFVALPDVASLKPSAQVREKYGAGDRMLVVALSDLSVRKHFDSFLYIAREYNRREAFRFLIPAFGKDKDTALWRTRLQESINQEGLHCATLLEETADFYSILDSSDLALFLKRPGEEESGAPLRVLEAMSLAKPVLCFDMPVLREIIGEFKPGWLLKNTEDFVRVTRDLKKDEAQLEQISTELARFARSKFSPEAVAAKYSEIYDQVLSGT